MSEFPTIATNLGQIVLGLLGSVVGTAAVAGQTVCVLTWLTLRGTNPQDRAAIVGATARLITALARLLHRTRR